MITNKFIHIHIPKTAGQLIRSIIHENKKHWNLCINKTHLTLKESIENLKENGINEKIRSFAIIRNPWDFYVSRYFYRRKLIKQGDVDEVIPIEQIGDNIQDFHNHIRQLNELFQNNNTVNNENNIPATTRTYKYITISEWYKIMTHPYVDFIGKFENLAEDLSFILHELAPNVFKMKDLYEDIIKKRAISEHLNYKEYYKDNEIAKIVYKWDEEYIREFKYTL